MLMVAAIVAASLEVLKLSRMDLDEEPWVVGPHKGTHR